jgi:uncharacterized repeat protein (TIGR01451 family)
MRRCHRILFTLAAALCAAVASAQTADVSITKSAPESVLAGETFDYSIDVFNSGPGTAQNVSMTDSLPFGTTFVSFANPSGTFTCSTPSVGTGGTITCTTPSLADQQEASFTITVKTSPGAPSGSISNTATVTSATNDPVTSNNSFTVSTGIAATSAASADLSIDSVFGSPNVAAGATMSVHLLIANKGPSTAHHVQVVTAVPANTTFLSASVADPLGAFVCGTPSVGTAGNITCSAPEFDPRSSSDQPMFLFTFRVNNGVPAGTVLTTTATLSADESDPVPSNNTAAKTTTVTSQAASADVSVGTAGGGSAFTVTVLNAGPNDAASVTLTDTVPAGSTFLGWTQTSGPLFNCTTPSVGGTGSITCTIVAFPGVQGETISAGFDLALNPSAQVTNNVTVSSSTPDPRPDNNSASFPVLAALSVDDVGVVEGNSGTTPATFTVRLQPANALLTATVDYEVTGLSATAGVDFAATQGTLTFRAGETQKTITVLVFGDTVPEPDEVFSLQLRNPVNAVFGQSFAFGTIADDDHGGPPLPAVSIANASITEGNSGTTNVTFSATLSIPSTTVARVRWQTQNGTALAGADYVAGSGELVFQPGETVKTFTVAIVGDVVFEPDELFNVLITGADNATFSSIPATCVILNDDVPAPSRHRAARP